MATFGTRNVIYANENQVLKGKPRAEPDVKRPVLKEVGNKLKEVPFSQLKGGFQNHKNIDKQENITSIKCPNVKQTVNKQPSIQVRETKACRLRTQHSRLSICKVPDKKTVVPEVPAKEGTDSVPKPQTESNVDVLPNNRLKDVHNEEIKESKVVTNIKLDSSKSVCMVPDPSKLPINKRHDAPSAFSSTLLNCAYIIDIDKEDENDPITLGMYAKDMYKYLREMEVKFPISPQYLKGSRLNGKMRATLIDWLVEVHREFDMNPETLFLNIAIIDRFLEKNPNTSRNQLQLVGITALFIAAKYEEILLPDVSELVYVSDNAFTKRDILRMEITIVKCLDCSFGRPLPIHFLRRYSKAEKVSPTVHVMAKYIMEIGIMDYDLCHIAPSLLAATALYISLWLLKRRENVWSNVLVQYSSYCVNDLLPVVKKVSKILVNASDSKLQAIRKKYSQPKNLQVSALPVMTKLAETYNEL